MWIRGGQKLFVVGVQLQYYIWLGNSTLQLSYTILPMQNASWFKYPIAPITVKRRLLTLFWPMQNASWFKYPIAPITVKRRLPTVVQITWVWLGMGPLACFVSYKLSEV